jgi:probable HAF family extracellular repeat protein
MRTQNPLKASTKTLIGMTVLAGLASAASSLAEEPKVQRYEYALVDLGTLGGSETVGTVMNDKGEVTGLAYLPGNASYHAFRSNGKVIEDLGTLGGTNSAGVSINHRGQVTGVADIAAGPGHAFVSNREKAMIDLGTFGGTGSYGSSINDAGQITGYANTTGDVATHAFLYSGGTILDLGTLGGNNSYGVAINSTGQVAGTADLPNGLYHAFVSNGGSPLVDLGTIDVEPAVGVSGAIAINSAGQVAGNGSCCGGEGTEIHPFLYQNGAIKDLGAFSGNDSIAQAMNNLGQVTGESELGFLTFHAFLYTNGSLKDLGTLGPSCGLCDSSYGNAINDFGEVVGSDAGEGTGFDTGRAIVYSNYSNGKLIDLNSLLSHRDAQLYTLTDAVAINNVGQVLVQGIVNSTNQQHSFVLTCRKGHPRPDDSDESSRCRRFISSD